MEFKNLRIVGMTPEYARDISGWRYEGEYSFYNHSENFLKCAMNGAYYACVDGGNKIVGYFCFGENSRIPTLEENIYASGYLDIGLGLKPEYCGKGFGLSFLNLGLKYAREYLNNQTFRLSVAAFNERAVKVYERAGFCKKREVTNSYFKNKFYIMTLS